MSQPLRVLLVEDEETDAKLVLHMLCTGGFAPEHLRVDTPEAMSAALAGGPWDIIISDYSMPKFSGLDALALLQGSGLDVPFIIVTGATGEEAAVRCMHEGASDYLLKDRLDRLPSAVRRALASLQEHRRRLDAERKLAASERRLRTIFETEPECVKLLGPDCMLLEMNPAGLRMIEADSIEQVRGRSVLGVVLPEHRAAFAALAERVLRGESDTLEFEIQGLKGGHRWLETRAVPMRDEQGRVTSLLGITRDTTERKRNEAALRASEDRFRDLFEHSPDAIFVESREGVVLDVNLAGCELHGMTRAQLVGRHVADLVPPAERERVKNGFARLAAGNLAKLEGFSWTADGRAVPVEITCSTIVFSGQPALLLHVRDITERKRAEEALGRERTLLRTLIDLLPDQIYMKDTQSRFLLANKAVAHLTGAARPEDLIGKSDQDIFSQDEADIFLRDEQDVLAGHALFNKEEAVPNPDGSQRFILTSKVPLKGSAGEIIGLVGIGRDITERKRAEESLRASEAQLNTVIQNLTEGMVISTLEGQLLHWNQAALDQHGFASEAEARRNVGEFRNNFMLTTLDGTAVPFEQWPLTRIMRGEKFRGCELRIRRLDAGWERVFSYGGEIVHPASGPALAFVTISDITERKRAEHAVQTSQHMLQLVLDNIPQGVFWKDRESRFLGCNAVVARSRGEKSAESLKGKTDRDFASLTPEQADYFIRKDREVMETCRPQLGIIEQTTRADGSLRWLETNKVPLHGADGNVIGVLGTWQDITERKKADEAVQTSQRMLQLVLDNIPQGVFWKDRDSRYLGCNALVAETFGLGNPEAILGKTDRDFAALTLEQAEFFVQKDREVMASRRPQLAIVEQATFADGSTHWLETNKVPLFDTAGKVMGILGTWQDITSRKETEETLKMMRFSVDRAGDSVVWVSREGRILYTNDAMCAGRGYTREEMLGMKIFDLDPDFQPDVWEPHFEDLKRSGTITFETRHRAKDGRIFSVEVNANYVFINGQEFNFATLRDITERQRQERLALRSQRMESIGTLAGGIAHDLNNALAPIMMSGELLRMEYPRESEMLDRIEASAKRAADMVRQLLAFAKGAEGARAALQPGRLIREMDNLMKGSFPKNIHLAVKCDPNLPTVLGDTTQLHQVLLNLCVNARDAMPRGGTLTLEAGCMEMDAGHARSVPDATPGRYVALCVQDTGTGIPPEIVDRIFDPFFTTKDPDKGTGLGLSTVMGIVKGHGGFTQVSSEPGQGATFTVYLPVDPKASEPEPVSGAAGTFRGHGETILFVDDETMVRNVARAVLTHLNFTPLTATDGADALLQASQHRTEIRAIITDLHMPHMDGLAFVREVRQLLPDVPIVVASGRMEDDEAEKLTALGVTGRLDKPFTQAELEEALKNLLATK